MRKFAISIVLLFVLVVLTTCSEAEYVSRLDQLANEATDIVRVHVQSRQTDDPSYITRLMVRGTYKGNYRYRDVIELYHPDYNGNAFRERGIFLLFLRSSEDAPTELINHDYSVFILYMGPTFSYDHFIFKNTSQQGDSEFVIDYQDLLALWDYQMQTVLDEYASLDFIARIEHPGSSPWWYFHHDDEPLEYPVAIKSMDELIAYKEIYSTYVLWWTGGTDPTTIYRNETIFGIYTEAFFEERFLVIFKFIEPSGSIGHRVDAILENGDIYVARLDIRPGHLGTMDLGEWLIILEVENSIIPEHLNLIVMDRWF